jgi:hypothetical protein
MHTGRQCLKSVAVILLIFGVAIIMSGVINVYAFPGLGPDIPAQDFILTASKTLIEMQPGMSGSLVIWATLYCPNATSSFVDHAWSNYNFACDTTILPIVNLQIISGCPGSALCILDRTQIMVLPVGPIASEAATNFFVYSLTNSCTACSCGSYQGGSVSTVTVVGTDQFGHTHTVQFGIAVGYFG